MTYAEIGFYLNTETTTLADAERLLDSLNVNMSYDVGGDDGAIQFTLDGEVLLHDIADPDVPALLRVIFGSGYCPSFINTGCWSFYKDELKAQYESLRGDCEALWEWMKDADKREMKA